MSTSHKAAMNRANAQHSTGPKTAEGKKKSSLNALRHGLTGQIVVMPGDDLEAYQRRIAYYNQTYRPVGPAEEDLVQTLAECAWRLHRVAAMENNLFTMGVTVPSPITDASDQVRDAFSITAALESQAKAISVLSVHTQRLSRQFERTINLLRGLQETRRAQEQHDLSVLLDIMETQKNKGEPYVPSEDGFVFSNEQIATALQFRNRQRRHDEALEYLDNLAEAA